MTTTFSLRQVKPLLTADELALFQASRRNAISHLSHAELRAQLTRARALRDKYRDLYRRQTVSTRTGRDAEGATTRQHKGDENSRTQLKHDVLADVVERFQARIDKQGDVEQAAGDDSKSTAGKGKAAKPKRNGAKSAKAAASGNATRQDDAPVMDIAELQQGVRDALAARQGHDNPPTDAMEAHTDVSAKASAQAHGAVPTDIVPAALRQNVLKQDPVNMKIHASARGRGKSYQAGANRRGNEQE